MPLWGRDWPLLALAALACLSPAGDGPVCSRLALLSPLFCEPAGWCLRLRLSQCFLVFGNFFFKTPFLGQISVPTSFVSLFIFHIFSYLLLKTMGCFSGCLMSSASIQKLFCGIYSAFKCSFDEFVGEKVISPSYSSAILGPPPSLGF